MHFRTALLSVLLAGFAQNAFGQADTDENRLSVLEAKLATLEAELGLIEDIKSIKRLQHAYAYYLSKGLADEIADLFSEQVPGTVEIGRQGVYVGRDSIREYFAHPSNAVGEGRLNNHIIAQGIVHVAPDGRTAKGRWRAFVQAGDYGEDGRWIDGPYENEFVKENGVWKISRLHWMIGVIGSYDEGWHRRAYPLPEPLEDLPADRAPTGDYTVYPEAQFRPYHFVHPVTGRPIRAD